MPRENMPRTWLQVARRDIASIAIHWTKAKPASSSFLRRGQPRIDASIILDNIVRESRLLGGNGFIKGGHICVCFTEAPLAEMVAVFASATLVGEEIALRYEPFGVGVSKEWLFERGGRPVIYQSDGEYDLLPEEFRWRHCRYEPPDVDFTWEREWRISMDRLDLDSSQTWIFVPTAEMADEFSERHPGWRIVPLELFGFPNLNDADHDEA